MNRSIITVVSATLLLAVSFATGIFAATLGDGAERAGPAPGAGAPSEALPGGTAGGGAGGGFFAEPRTADQWLTIGGDTIRYRVCKDLTVCYLEFTYPAVGIVPGVPGAPPTAGIPHLTPFELATAPAPPVVTDARWALLGFPLIAVVALGTRGSNRPPGTQPGTTQPPGVEPPGTQPPGPPPPTTPIPEPTSMILLGTGLAGLAIRARRNRTRSDTR